MLEKEVQIIETEIYSSDDSFTDESVNKDESEIQNIGKVSTHQEILTRPKGRSKGNIISSKEGETGSKEGTHNLLDEFDSKSNGKSVSSNERRTREETYLRICFLALLPSCTVLLQLIILVTPYIIVSVWATTYMMDISRFYNTVRTYGQVRLGKTRDHCPIVGGYSNFTRPCPELATIQ